MLDVSRQLKKMGAKRVFIFSTFGLFTNGFKKFDDSFEKKEFDRIFTTNLIYQKPELLKKDYYYSVSMNRYIAAIIDTMNKGKTLSSLTRPALKIRDMIENYKKKDL